MTRDTGAVVRFLDFVPGTVLGRHDEAIGPALLKPWTAMFPAGSERAPLPPGVSVAVVVRAYMAILPVRPPGNVHARQRICFHRALTPGERVTTELTCTRAELRKDRRWIHFRTVTTDSAGATVCMGEMTMLWAA